ncbi:hypothetical protein CMV_005667 [Castanea mollissima]|uniref:Transmembrane protein n=1 Tax=Castanea mollissima TaxID=60419 RepID=A0A8J4W1I2_9ROSI|nr:hypothetical protein CMV_005667 [Castanea mollissima]
MNKKGERDPTMKGYHIEKKREQDKLQHQFVVLQQDWHSYNQSHPKTHRRYLTNSNHMAKSLQRLDSSPRSLMSSLQQRLSPPEGAWKVRTNDLAMEEIRRERKAVIESGRLKGRRLFEADESETETGFGWKEKMCNGLAQESEVRSVSFCDSDDDDDHENETGGMIGNVLPICFQCCCSSSSSLSSLSSFSVRDEYVKGEVVVEEEKKVVASVEIRRDSYGGSGNGRRWMVVMGWLAIASIVYAICIVRMRSFGGYRDEHEMILVPT